MNIRSLSRGDGVVIVAAVLLFIASFLDTAGCRGSYCNSQNSWDDLGLGLGTYMIGVVGGALVVISRGMPQRKVLGQDLGSLGVASTVVVAWVLLWWTIDFPTDAGAGLVLGLIAALALAGAAVATPLVPALQAPLTAAPGPQGGPQPYGGQPPQGGYGYPGGQQPPFGGQPQPGQPSFGGQPQAQQAQQGAPAGDFSPFWFAVPVQRPLYAEDGSSTEIAQLAPGTWYLAVEQRGPGLVAQTQDGRRGVLQDTSNIQRG
ncbi:hypothetical protein [Streptomyces sp. NPDC058045]|uniref:hypothetical protein n=1 Tax=Streptomyces sp. NPDC058045 TaxID=3346311 RepID=UPI0036EBFF0E